MTETPLYLYLSLILAAFISIFVWIDYFRKIDVFEKEKISNLFIAIGIGCLTPILSLYIYDLFEAIGFRENGKPINDLIYSILGIGLNEELSKIAGAIIAFRILRKAINESIDYLIYAGMVAIGFALVENFMYLKAFGIDIITNRSFYSVLEHIINTSIITYGYFRFKIFAKGNPVLNTLTGLMLAISSHGLFDYFIFNPAFEYSSQILVIIVYLFGINFWITMLNNCVNYSSFFDYEKIQYPGKIFYRLLWWYFLTMLIGLIYKGIYHGPEMALSTSINNVISNGFLFLTVILRASRFRIYKNLYQKVTLQLPFYLTNENDEDFRLLHFFAVKIRGENEWEYFLTTKIGKKLEMHSVNMKISTFKKPVNIKVLDKLFLKHNLTVYKIEVEKESSHPIYLYLKPKTHGTTMINEIYPINSLHQNNTEHQVNEMNNLGFLEWVYLKPENEITAVNY